MIAKFLEFSEMQFDFFLKKDMEKKLEKREKYFLQIKRL